MIDNPKYIDFPDTAQLHSELLSSRPNQNVLEELSVKMINTFKENGLVFNEENYGKFSFNRLTEYCIGIESSERISFPTKCFNTQIPIIS